MIRKIGSVMILLFLFTAAPLTGESVRGIVSGIIDLSDDTSTEADLGIGELVALIPGDGTAFLDGAEVQIQIPQAIKDQSDSFILLVYKRVSPAPDEGVRRYQGSETAHFVLPSRSRLYMNIPLSGGGAGNGGPDTLTITPALSADEFPLLITLLPLSKGIPPGISNQSLSVKAVPRWNGLGGLEVRFPEEFTGNETAAVSVDGKPRPWEPLFYLSRGIHALEVSAPGYKTVNMSINIQQAGITAIDIPMEKAESTLLFELPEEAAVFLDGEPVNYPPGTPIDASEGPHTLTVLLNDYQISKQFRLNSGESLKISLFLDILIEEN